MRFFETKHERNSAKITTLLILILALLLFVVGPQYMDPPIEYGVAINFGEPSSMNAQNVPDMPTKSEEIIEDNETEDVSLEDEILEEEIDELIEEPQEEIVEEQTQDLAEEQLEKEAQDQTDAERAAEELLAEQEVEAERLKAEKEAKEKQEADRIADEKAEREALAKAEREAKVKAAREAPAKAEKAEADRKAAAAAAAAKNNSGGSDVVGFAVIEEAPIYPGCEGLDNEARKNCMSTKVTQFVTSRFDQEIASTLGFTGTQRIRLNFKIDKTGKVVDIIANAADPKLKEEAERIAKLLPKLKPGIQQGKAVTVPYAVTVRFKAKE